MHSLLSCTALAALGVAQESATVIDAPLVVLPADNRVEQLIDLDHDGWTDLVSWWYKSNGSALIQVRGWRNDQAGGFTQLWEYYVAKTGSGTWAHLALGDVDGDGELDIVSEFGRTIAVHKRVGTSLPTLHQAFSVPDPVGSVVCDDFDGDGLADFAYVDTLGTLRVFENTGASGGFQLAPASSVALGSVKSILRVGELTGDGVRDLLAVTDQAIQIAPLNADGTLQPTVSIATASVWGWPRPVIGDVDGDGDDDALVWDGYGTGFSETLRRTSATTLQLEPVQVGGPGTELADIDQDGDLDGICCGGGGSIYSWKNAGGSEFNICWNDGSGVFTPSFQMRGTGSTHIAGATDIDHDGDIDLVAGRAIYYARGPFTGPPLVKFTAPEVSPYSTTDFDGDGDLDLSVSIDGAVVSDGAYAFTPQGGMPAAPAGSTFVGPGYPGDFDGDGDNDLVVLRLDAGVFAQMQLLRNQGAGVFVDAGAAGAPGVHFGVGPALAAPTRASLAADLDADGDVDLVTRGTAGYWSSESSKLWLNDGSGSFTAGSSLPGIHVIAVAKFNADAHVDLLCSFDSASSSVNLIWMRGTGGASFQSVGQLPAFFFDFEGAYDEAVVEDLDADGDIDVVAGNHDENFTGETYLWRNNGNGVFTRLDLGVACDQNATAIRVLAADLDGNGFRDLVVYPLFENYAGSAILMRSDDGATFSPAIEQAVQPAALVDLESDGDADPIDFAPYAPGTYRLMRSTAFAGPDVGARRQYGAGSPGTGGFVPLVGAVGPFRVGEAMQLRMRGGRGGANAILAIGLTESAIANAPFAGMTTYVWPVKRRLGIKLLGPAGVAGAGWRDLNVTVPAELAGLSYYHQLFVFDAGAPHGLACSNGLEVQYD
ncbi:MAG: VCBS repeat-containing protein [Planctomycetes bacterium]|nr:VCBS repeat-containing protein [Planctomycetota bacterium]